MKRTITVYKLEDGTYIQHGPKALKELKAGNIATMFDLTIDFDIAKIVKAGCYNSIDSNNPNITPEEIAKLAEVLK